LRYCCFALGNLLYTFSDNIRETVTATILQENLIAVLLQMIPKNIHCPDLIQQICFALGNLLSMNDFEYLLLSQNGVPIVLLVLQLFPQNPMILTEAIFILKNLSFSEQGRTSILENPSAIDLLLNSLENHMSNNSELVDLCINLLSDLTLSGLLASERAINLIVQSLILYKSSQSIVTQCLTAISKYYNSSDPQKIMIIRSGIVPILLELDFPDKTKIQRLLYHFSQDRLKYIKNPSADTPSLGELSSRVICNRNIHQLLEDSHYLPNELKKFLDTKKSCNVCGLSYFDHFYEKIDYSMNSKVNMILPSFIVACSKTCLENDRQ